jgi:hypothetical protein
MRRTLRDGSIEDRHAEIAEILAAGLMRLRARKSSELAADRGECLLDCAARQSGHADPHSRESEA